MPYIYICILWRNQNMYTNIWLVLDESPVASDHVHQSTTDWSTARSWHVVVNTHQRCLSLHQKKKCKVLEPSSIWGWKAGWWLSPTPLKNMSSLVGMMTFPTEWKVVIHSMVPVTTNQKEIWEYEHWLIFTISVCTITKTLTFSQISQDLAVNAGTFGCEI